MNKLLKILKLWPFHRMDMGRIDKLDFCAVLITSDKHWQELVTAISIQMGKALDAEIMATTGKSAQLDYIR